MINIREVVVGLLRTNCYIVSNQEDECIIIDPGANFSKIDYLLTNKKVKAILLTHGHFDHIGAVEELINKYKCNAYCHIKDKILVENSKANGSSIYSRNIIEIKNNVTYFNDKVEIDGFDIETIYTPGHTKGSVSYLFDRTYMFSGDFLFKGSIGRCDMYNASVDLMKKSCKKIIMYHDDIIVYPGHDEKTTIKEEKENNPYLK